MKSVLFNASNAGIMVDSGISQLKSEGKVINGKIYDEDVDVMASGSSEPLGYRDVNARLDKNLASVFNSVDPQ